MQLNAATLIRLVGVVLFTVVFVHLWSMPWGLVAGAGLACLTL